MVAAIKIYGQVRSAESRKGIPDMIVEAMDADLFFDDCLGSARTGPDGTYSIEYSREKSSDLFRGKPDVYVIVRSNNGKALKSTKANAIYDVESDVEINVDIPRAALIKAGLAQYEPAGWMENIDPEKIKKFAAWTFQPGYNLKDAVLEQIQKDAAGKASILELLKQYMDEVRTSPDNNAVQFTKMAKLFHLGLAPDAIEGHFYGVPLCFKTGDQEGSLASIGNIIEILWGVTLAGESPWVGKSFASIADNKLDAVTFGALKPGGKAFLGINHFNKIEVKALNIFSFHFLNLWLGLEPSPQEERKNYGHEKTGGNFIAAKGRSVYHGTDREVFQLNYRWKNLNNKAPLCWLIDEIVQIAEGLYLGQLLFSTRRLLRDYDPERPVSDYDYQHFGYFVLFDETWNMEARRLFPFLEIPVTAPGMVDSNAASLFELPKFSTFTLEEPALPICKDEVFAQIRADIKDKPTIMHLLKEYSDKLQGTKDNNSPYFLRLQEIFNRGIGIRDVEGHYRGALVSWHSEGMFKIFDLNTINLVWTSLFRKFSTWTGKSFENIPKERLEEITGGYEKGEVPTRWGANTQSLRTFKEKFVGSLMNLTGVWNETAAPEEALIYGYDMKNFFFIARRAKSLNENCKGKTIYQFNYRWPKLKTIIPDRYCIDEIVQIARGLYLGQLMYATEVLKPYDPTADPSVYKYANFGYFLLMDEEWHQIRLKIGFDLTNV